MKSTFALLLFLLAQMVAFAASAGMPLDAEPVDCALAMTATSEPCPDVSPTDADCKLATTCDSLRLSVGLIGDGLPRLRRVLKVGQFALTETSAEPASVMVDIPPPKF